MKTIITAIILLAAGAAGAAPAPATAYVNFERIWTESDAGKASEALLQQQVSQDRQTVADAEKRKDPDAAAMRASMPQVAQNRRMAAGQRLQARVAAMAAKLRAARHLHEVRETDPQTLAVENDVTNDVIALLNADDKAQAAADQARKAAEARAAKAEADAADLRRQLAAKDTPQPSPPARK